MEQQPQNNDEWERKIETELSTDGILNAPLEGDDCVSFGKLLQDQINRAPEDLQNERAMRAKDRIDEHFSDHYGRLMFVNTDQAFVFHKGENDEPHRGFSFTHADISGELKSAQVIEADDKPYVVFAIKDATIHWNDADNGELRTFEAAASPTLVPISFITSHELL